jgi:chorismate mutase
VSNPQREPTDQPTLEIAAIPYLNGPEASPPIVCRGVRGATTVTENNREAILVATRELLRLIIRSNGIRGEDVASVFFTTTTDLNAEYPALAARQLGWMDVALMCSHEMSLPHGVPLCVRVLIHWNTNRGQKEIHHIYLHGAAALRPDRSISTQEIARLQALEGDLDA